MNLVVMFTWEKEFILFFFSRKNCTQFVAEETTIWLLPFFPVVEIEKDKSHCFSVACLNSLADKKCLDVFEKVLGLSSSSHPKGVLDMRWTNNVSVPGLNFLREAQVFFQDRPFLRQYRPCSCDVCRCALIMAAHFWENWQSVVFRLFLPIS